MNRFHSTTILAAALLLIIASGVQGEEVQANVRLAAFQTAAPELGFASQHISGFGVQVTSVSYGSKAYRLGLEQDDVILAVNGRRLACSNAWQEALDNACLHGGKLTLKIRDSHTGSIAVRHTNVFSR